MSKMLTKKRFFALVLTLSFLSINSLASETLLCPNPPGGLVEVGNFDGSIGARLTDRSTYSVGDVGFTDGVIDQAVDFQGRFNFIVVPSNEAIFFSNDQAFTATLWFKPTSNESAFCSPSAHVGQLGLIE